MQLRRFFFQPLELHLELADFLEELRLSLGRFGHAWRCLRCKDFRQSLQHFLFPLAHLHRVHLVFGGYRVHRLHSFERFQPYLGFELGTELTSTFLRHGLDRFFGFGFNDPSCPVFRDHLIGAVKVPPDLVRGLTAAVRGRLYRELLRLDARNRVVFGNNRWNAARWAELQESLPAAVRDVVADFLVPAPEGEDVHFWDLSAALHFVPEEA